MSELAALERAKRRRLQEAYEDLRPGTGRGDDKQAKLRNLLLGAAADAGAPSDPATVRALAAAAAASITSVGSSPGARTVATAGALPPRRGALGSPAGATPTTSPASASAFTPNRSRSGSLITTTTVANSTTAAPLAGCPLLAPAFATGPGRGLAGPGHGPGLPNGGGRGGGGCDSLGPRRAPPPGPMEGGFLPEGDPIQRLSKLLAAPPDGASGRGGGGGGFLGRGAEGGASARGGLWVPAGGVAAGAGPAQPLVAAGQHVYTSAGGGGWAGDEEEDEAVEVPSDIELALIALKDDLRSHPGCAELPPLALRSQLAALLADRSTVERQLDEQQRANRVRVFKLPTGPDEVGVLTTSDYRAVVRQAADDAAAAAAAAVAASATTAAGGGGGGGGGPCPSSLRAAQSAPGALGGSSGGSGGGGGGSTATAADSWVVGAYGCGSGGSGTSRWHVAAESYLQRVVDRFTEFQLSHQHLVHLLSTPPPPPVAAAAAAATAEKRPTGLGHDPPQQRAPGPQGGPGRSQPGPQGRLGPGGSGSRPGLTGVGSGGRDSGPGGGRPVTVQEVEEQISLLLHLGCIARHTDGDADAYVLAVPGAGKLVKSVLGGRKELLTWLSKRQHQEAHEEQVCKLKLRTSCLPALFHVRDLLGRGAVRRLESTSGPLLKLPWGKGAAGRKQG